jgi:elongation factor P
MLSLSDLKVGTHVQLEGAPFTIVSNQFSKKARGGGVMKTKLKNLISGSVIEKTFQGSDKVEPADIGYRRAQFLYRNGDEFEFMDQETFDTVNFSAEVLGDQIDFLLEGMDVDIQYFGTRAINMQLPPKMTFEIIETEPGVKGDTAQGGTKNAVIDTGFNVKVPLFITKGEKIVVNTTNGEYVERAKK